MNTIVDGQEIFEDVFKIPFDDFNTHMENENNRRILFSGQFGMGKTTFLKYFFGNNKEKYNTFHLYPVNYSVLDNADIFTYIKYDLLYEMLVKHQIQLPSNDTNIIKTYHDFIYQNFLQRIVGLIILSIPGIGKQYNQLHNELLKISTEFKEFKEAELSEEWKAVKGFWSGLHKEEGGLYEENFVTEIIIDTLRKLKEKSQKENVLIIDDLDRIDPHHIFRLLNVFAAHFDQRNENTELYNKFGFDKVIFVGDIKNIRSIFNHFYGIQTSFNGYLDKFYSEEPFYFENKRRIHKVIKYYIYSLGIKVDGDKIETDKWYEVTKILVIIFNDIAKAKCINLRMLCKYETIQIETDEFSFEGVDYGEDLFIYVLVLKILIKYFDSVEDLKLLIKNINPTFPYDNYKFEYLVPLCGLEQNRLSYDTQMILIL